MQNVPGAADTKHADRAGGGAVHRGGAAAPAFAFPGAASGQAHFQLAVVCVAVFCLAAIGILCVPLVLPVGPLYWDTFIYYDAIGRIETGQLPGIDFLAPAGPLEYFLAWLGYRVFPSAHPVLLTQFQWLPLTAPLLIVILRDARRHGPVAVWGLVIPWLVMSALPFNPGGPHSPGVDGYGIYNRNAAHLMFLASAAILFLQRAWVQVAVFSLVLLALAFCKITAFVAVGPLFLLGFAAGRLSWRTALATTVICLWTTLCVEWATGLVSAYLGDLQTLLSLNSEGEGKRLLRAVENRFDVVLATLILCSLPLAPLVRPPKEEAAWIRAPFDRPWIWISVSLFCGVLFETQNTGGHPYAIMLPALLLLALLPLRPEAGWRWAALVAVAFIVVPMTADMISRAAGTLVRLPSYERVDAANLGGLGRVSAKPRWLERAAHMRAAYSGHPGTFEELAAEGELPAPALFADPDFQTLYLQELSAAVAALVRLETVVGRHAKTVYLLDFTSPLAFLMGREAPRHVSIGAAPGRTVPPLTPETAAALDATELILEPKCPAEAQQLALAEHFKPALTGRSRYRLTPCYDVLLQQDSAWARYFDGLAPQEGPASDSRTPAKP